MTTLANRTASAAPASSGSALAPFGGLIDAILVDEPVLVAFPGAVSRKTAQAIWVWVARDLCSDIISHEQFEQGTLTPAELDSLMPELLARMKAALVQANADIETGRRLTAQLGRDDGRDRLPVVMLALRNRALLTKAEAFGRATNTISDDTALGAAISAMPLQDPALAALVFHAALGQVANPTLLITAAIKLAGAPSEAAISRVGLSPLIDAYIAHAQSQLHLLQLSGPFSDVDLVCRALERLHKLVRSLTGYIEFSRGSQATAAISTITKFVSDRLEPRIKEVVTDINQAMRRREGADRLDTDRLLAAVSGTYLLATVRDCRDSLALNAVFDQAWSQSAQALEVHIQRNMELYRANPDDKNTAARLDAVIKMAQLRFSNDYAETLKKARKAAERPR
jgi:hypothetical protein